MANEKELAGLRGSLAEKIVEIEALKEGLREEVEAHALTRRELEAEHILNAALTVKIYSLGGKL